MTQAIGAQISSFRKASMRSFHMSLSLSLMSMNWLVLFSAPAFLALLCYFSRLSTVIVATFNNDCIPYSLKFSSGKYFTVCQLNSAQKKIFMEKNFHGQASSHALQLLWTWNFAGENSMPMLWPMKFSTLKILGYMVYPFMVVYSLRAVFEHYLYLIYYTLYVHILMINHCTFRSCWCLVCLTLMQRTGRRTLSTLAMMKTQTSSKYNECMLLFIDFHDLLEFILFMQWFWELVHAFDRKKLAILLQFATGRLVVAAVEHDKFYMCT